MANPSRPSITIPPPTQHVVLQPDNLPDNDAYKDYTDETPFQRSDNPQTSTLRHRIWTIFRGRAMPIRKVFVAFLWAIFSVLLSWVTRNGYGPHERGECRWWCSPLSINGDALSYVGFALFLLTSFRASEAYNRYMQGVRIWTTIAGTVQGFAKFVVQAFPSGSFHVGDRERILGFLVAYPVALKRELRDEKDLAELKHVLTEEDLGKIQNADSMSSYCLYVLSDYILKARQLENHLPQAFIVTLLGSISDLASCGGSCTQIKTLPAPYSYVSHLETFLTLWLFFLPYALVESTGWATIVIVTFIAYGVLGIIANAVELENPFGSDYNDLPLGRLANGITSAVADVYRTAESQEHIVHQVADESLKAGDNYWLKFESKS